MQPGDSCYGLIECRPRLQHDVIHGDTGMPCHCLTESIWQVRPLTRSALPREPKKRPAKGHENLNTGPDMTEGGSAVAAGKALLNYLNAAIAFNCPVIRSPARLSLFSNMAVINTVFHPSDECR